jgi:thiol-disulfide isomerase/thioredoxin
MSTATPPRTGRPARGRQPKQTPARSGPSLTVLLAVGVLVLLLLALLLSGGDDDSLSQTAPVAVDGAALPAFVAGQVDAAVGLPAPALTGVSFDGTAVEVEPGRAPTVVLFAAHWCQFCQREVRELAPWLAEGEMVDAGVEIRVVSTAVDATASNYPPSAWFEREAWPGPVMVDSDAGAAAAAYGLSGYPFFTFLDREGTVVARASGALGAEEVAAMVARLAE